MTPYRLILALALLLGWTTPAPAQDAPVDSAATDSTAVGESDLPVEQRTRLRLDELLGLRDDIELKIAEGRGLRGEERQLQRVANALDERGVAHAFPRIEVGGNAPEPPQDTVYES